MRFAAGHWLPSPAVVLLSTLFLSRASAQLLVWKYPPAYVRGQNPSYNWKIGSRQLLVWDTTDTDFHQSTVRLEHINPNAKNSTYDYSVNICSTAVSVNNCTWTVQDLRLDNNDGALWHLMVGVRSADTPSVDLTISSEDSNLSNPATNTTSPTPTYASMDLTTATGTAAPMVNLTIVERIQNKPPMNHTLIGRLNENINGSSYLTAVSELYLKEATIVPLGSITCTAWFYDGLTTMKFASVFNATTGLVLTTKTVEISSITCRSSVFDNVRLVSAATNSSSSPINTTAATVTDKSTGNSPVNNGLGKGILAGIIVAAIAILIAASLMAFFLLHRRRKRAAAVAAAGKNARSWDKTELDGDNTELAKSIVRPPVELPQADMPEMDCPRRIHEAGSGAVYEMNARASRGFRRTIYEIGPSR